MLATKLYGGMGDWPNQTFLSALAVRQQCDASLKLLQTDHIDLYQMHHIDRSALWEESDVLKQQGKILYVGSSNFPGWSIAQANERPARRGTFGLASVRGVLRRAGRRPGSTRSSPARAAPRRRRTPGDAGLVTRAA